MRASSLQPVVQHDFTRASGPAPVISIWLWACCGVGYYSAGYEYGTSTVLVLYSAVLTRRGQPAAYPEYRGTHILGWTRLDPGSVVNRGICPTTLRIDSRSVSRSISDTITGPGTGPGCQR